MIPNSKAEALAHLQKIWAGQPELHIGQVIIDYLSSNLDAQYFPITVFFEVTKSSDEHRDSVLNIVNYLSGGDLNLLKLDIELIESEEIVLLDHDEARNASIHFIHPISGTVDKEILNKLFLCFSPSDVAKKALRV